GRVHHRQDLAAVVEDAQEEGRGRREPGHGTGADDLLHQARLHGEALAEQAQGEEGDVVKRAQGLPGGRGLSLQRLAAHSRALSFASAHLTTWMVSARPSMKVLVCTESEILGALAGHALFAEGHQVIAEDRPESLAADTGGAEALLVSP